MTSSCTKICTSTCEDDDYLCERKNDINNQSKQPLQNCKDDRSLYDINLFSNEIKEEDNNYCDSFSNNFSNNLDSNFLLNTQTPTRVRAGPDVFNKERWSREKPDRESGGEVLELDPIPTRFDHVAAANANRKQIETLVHESTGCTMSDGLTMFDQIIEPQYDTHLNRMMRPAVHMPPTSSELLNKPVEEENKQFNTNKRGETPAMNLKKEKVIFPREGNHEGVILQNTLPFAKGRKLKNVTSLNNYHGSIENQKQAGRQPPTYHSVVDKSIENPLPYQVSDNRAQGRDLVTGIYQKVETDSTTLTRADLGETGMNHRMDPAGFLTTKSHERFQLRESNRQINYHNPQKPEGIYMGDKKQEVLNVFPSFNAHIPNTFTNNREVNEPIRQNRELHIAPKPQPERLLNNMTTSNNIMPTYQTEKQNLINSYEYQPRANTTGGQRLYPTLNDHR